MSLILDEMKDSRKITMKNGWISVMIWRIVLYDDMRCYNEMVQKRQAKDILDLAVNQMANTCPCTVSDAIRLLAGHRTVTLGDRTIQTLV